MRNNFLNIHTTKEFSSPVIPVHTRVEIAREVVKIYPHVNERYVIDCFDRYPTTVLHSTHGQVCGIFFYNFFARDDEGFFYFGPLFFFSRAGFALGTSRVIRKYLTQFRRVFFLAEVQNPELIIHLHAIFPTNIQPEPFSFAISERARLLLKIFQSVTPQLDTISEDNFCSHGKETIFYRNRKSSVLGEWLLKHGINLEKNQALVVLIELTYWKFLLSQIKILFRFITYPSHKIKYLKMLTHIMRNHNDKLNSSID